MRIARLRRDTLTRSPSCATRTSRPNCPGPKARAHDRARRPRSSRRRYPRDYPFAISHGRGTEVWDVDGNRFLDFAAGIAVCSTGHAHPRRGRGHQGGGRQVPAHLERLLAREHGRARRSAWPTVAPMGEPVMSFLCQSGTESVEGALKLARYVTGRPRFIGFLGGFHGRTMGSLSFTSSKYTQQKGFAPTMPGVTHVPVPEHLPAAVRRQRPGPGGARLHPHAVRAQRAAVRGRRDPGRADPGRGRLPRAARRLPRRACARSATSTASCSSSTRCSRASAAPAGCSPASTGACGPTS